MINEIIIRLRESAQVDEYYAVTMHRPMLLTIADILEKQEDEIKRLKADLQEYKTPQRIQNAIDSWENILKEKSND